MYHNFVQYVFCFAVSKRRFRSFLVAKSSFVSPPKSEIGQRIMCSMALPVQ